LRSPDFIIGGAQKASTSWLKTVINDYPDVWMPSFEIHYFSNDPCSWTLEEYLGLFSISHAKVVGEKSTSYLGVISEIINTLPKTQIFLILRDPFDRLASQYFHVLRHGRHQGKNIQEFVAEDIGNCLELGLYYRSLKDYLDRVNILFFEDIISRPETVVREVMEVLGLSVSHLDRLIPKRRVNRRTNKLALDYKSFLKEEGIADNLRNYYQDDIAQLETVTGRDLSNWKEW
jgi:hypothetical protein